MWNDLSSPGYVDITGAPTQVHDLFCTELSIILAKQRRLYRPDACEKSMSIYYKSQLFSIFLANKLAENGDAKRKYDPCSRTKPSSLLV